MSKVASENNTNRFKTIVQNYVMLMDITYHQTLLMNVIDDVNDFTLEGTRSWEM